MTTIAHLLGQDALSDAIAMATETVKSQPDNAQARGQLAELCLIAGDLERADTHAKLAGRLDAQETVRFGLFRQTIHGMWARQAWWQDGAVPEFPMGQTPRDEVALRLNVALKAGDGDEAKAALDELERLRGEQPTVWNGNPVSDLRDLDDRLPHALEAITSGGHYLWIDFTCIAEVEFTVPQRPVDLVCRKARVTLRDDSAADLLVPAVYPGGTEPQHMLARQTDFVEAAGGLTLALGQRAYLAGDTMTTLLEAKTITFPEGRDG